jgi:hypothetical protein
MLHSIAELVSPSMLSNVTQASNDLDMGRITSVLLGHDKGSLVINGRIVKRISLLRLLLTRAGNLESSNIKFQR